MVTVSTDPFLFNTTFTVDALALDALLLSDVNVAALLWGAGLSFTSLVVFNGTGGGFSGTIFTVTTGFFVAAVLVVDAADLIELILGLLLAASGGPSLLPSASGTSGGRLGVTLAEVNIVEMGGASDVRLNLGPAIAAALVAAVDIFINGAGASVLAVSMPIFLSPAQNACAQGDRFIFLVADDQGRSETGLCWRAS